MDNNLGNKEIMARNIQKLMDLYDKDRTEVCKSPTTGIITPRKYRIFGDFSCPRRSRVGFCIKKVPPGWSGRGA